MRPKTRVGPASPGTATGRPVAGSRSGVAVLGGVDVDLLSRQSPKRIRERTLEILKACAPGGGYACGSGNSITNYVPTANYLAMLETVHRFNGQM